jgi:MFS family permease
VGVLFGLNLVDEFDRIAFATLTPELRDAFGLTDGGIAAVSVLTGLFLLFSAVPLGVIADRVPRVRLAATAALLWGTMSVLTGVVPTLALLVVVRLFAGVGRAINEIVHPSLLTDMYDADDLPGVFFVHRLANPLSALSAILAGALGSALGYRWTFVLLAIPTVPLLLALRRLPEPVRGHPDHPATTIPFRQAMRTLRAIPTLRRIWWAAFLIGIAAVPVGIYLTLFFEDIYHFGAFARGGVQLVFGAGTVVGLIAGGRLASRWGGQASGCPALATHCGRWLALAAGGLLLTAVMPWAPLSVAALFVLGLGIGGYQPPYLSVIGRISPPALRAQVFGTTALCLGVGGVASLLLFGLEALVGYRLMFVATAVIATFGAFVAMSASQLVAADVVAIDATTDRAADLLDPTTP